MWNLTEDVHSVEVLAIALDALTAILLILVGGVLFQAWRARGGSLRRFKLSTFLVFVALVAVAVQYVVRQRQAGQGDRAVVTAMSPGSPERLPDVAWHAWGPTWLRRLLGEAAFAGCDRAVGAYGLESPDIAAAVGLQKLKDVYISGDISNEDLQLLGELPDLDDLCLEGCGAIGPGVEAVTVEAEECWPRFSFPPMANLRHLHLSFSRIRLAGLEKLKRLEVLELSGSKVRDDDMRGIGQLRTLRLLDLSETAVSSVGLAQLTGLHEVQELWLDGTRVDDAGIQHVANLKQLRTLVIEGQQITDSSISSLNQLAHLEHLRIYDTAISAEGLAGLAGLPEFQELWLIRRETADAFDVRHLAGLTTLRVLTLGVSSLTDADIPSLERFTHLEFLGLYDTGITADGFAALRRALPNCKIYGYSPAPQTSPK